MTAAKNSTLKDEATNAFRIRRSVTESSDLNFGFRTGRILSVLLDSQLAVLLPAARRFGTGLHLLRHYSWQPYVPYLIERD
jgi:hypothetical protein